MTTETASKRPTGFARHLEGWQLGVVAVGIALFGALLVVPRAVEPTELPPPVVDRTLLRRAALEDAARADRAEGEELPYDVRAVGEAIRAIGAAAPTQGLQPDLLGLLRNRVKLARQHGGDEPLLSLRAAQTRLFLHALDEWQRSDKEPPDLRDLGGDFANKATHSGWVDRTRRPALSMLELSVMFRLRWTELCGLRETHPFSPTLDEWRLYLGALLRLPEDGAGRSAAELADPRLRYVKALAQHDPDYPADLARGIALYQRGAFPDAAAALRIHLAAHPSGPWKLRATNYLAAAAANSPEEEEGF